MVGWSYLQFSSVQAEHHYSIAIVAAADNKLLQ